MEEAYRARPEPYKTEPFEGACNEVIPVIAMAVDPVVARLYTGVFKQDPTFTLRALKKQFVDVMPSLNQWVEYYAKNRLKIHQVMQPRLHEFTNLGSCVVKTVYDVEATKVKSYDEEWNVVDKEVTRFRGPRVFGISLGNFLFPAGYQHLQQRVRNAPNAGFSPEGVGTWLPVNPNYEQGVNVVDQLNDPKSMLHFYKSMLRVRKQTPALISGDYSPLHKTSNEYFAFTRHSADPEQTCLVVLNLSDKAQSIKFEMQGRSARCLFSTHKPEDESFSLGALEMAPFEVFVGELSPAS